MTKKSISPRLEKIREQLLSLRNDALTLEENHSDELKLVKATHLKSAQNLLHYLGVRQHDIRVLQQDLAALGLSSLGVLEPHTLASLNSDITMLDHLLHSDNANPPSPPVDFQSGPQQLRDQTRALLGPEPDNRFVRIMVTMPSEAATNSKLLEQLLLAGMNIMRINCAHDGPNEWLAMISNLHTAERKVGRSCRIQADLAGPKLRTGAIKPSGKILKIKPKRDIYGQVVSKGRVWLTSTKAPQIPPDNIHYTINLDGKLLNNCQPGDRALFVDSRGQNHELLITERRDNSLSAEIDRTAYVKEGELLVVTRRDKHIGEAHIKGIPEVILPIPLSPGDLLVLTRANKPGRPARIDDEGKVIKPAHIHCTLDAAFQCAEPGQRIWFDDGKIGGVVKKNSGKNITVEITHTKPAGGKLRADKGINLPGISFSESALTEKDIKDLGTIAKQVDMVALSFLREADDVLRLEEEILKIDAGHLGIVLKIENVEAFKNLPRILLASMRTNPVGIMVARGDLAVEVGFERMSEVQQEILWLCEAAHIPVIWATQILEGMVKKGTPSRAEVSDAAMSVMAECAMLNKGPNIVESVRFLSGIIERMDEHYVKRRATLRKLSVAQL